MKAIIFPQQSNNSVHSYRSVFQQYYEAIASQDDVTFECGNVQFFRPLGMNILSALLFDVLRRRGNNKVYFVHPSKSQTNQYLADQDFYKEFPVKGVSIDCAHRSTSVGLRRFSADNPDYSYFEAVSPWLRKNLAVPVDIIEELVPKTLVEVLNNVVDHSRSPIGCYICAQYYPKQEQLIFSVVDLGVGFLQTLLPIYPRLTTQTEALSLAVQEGVTSNPTGKNIGAGLFVLRGFLETLSGELEILSLNGRWYQGRNGDQTVEKLPFQFPGSCLNICFHKDAILEKMPLLIREAPYD